MLMASCSLLNAADDVLPGPGETGGGGTGQGGDPTTTTTSTSATMTGTSTSTSSAGGGGPTCGDGVVEADETCDPPASCPTQCDDGESCTTQLLQGDAASCTAACETIPINDCGPPDGCCLPGCDVNLDADCTCGNGIIEPGETCDGNCPLNCDDGSSCTLDQQTGDITSCDVVCTHDPILNCISGDGCCPPGCGLVDDNDCGGTCVGNAQWTPVTCITPEWVWSSDRGNDTVAAANAAHTLFTGLNDQYCSLDGAGWVSTTPYVMTDFGDCDINWYHLGGSFTGNCGGWGMQPVRRLAVGSNDCYPY
jgi:hypothetical protein